MRRTLEGALKCAFRDLRLELLTREENFMAAGTANGDEEEEEEKQRLLHLELRKSKEE